MAPSAAAAKKQPITLKQISEYDDILTDALVDHVSIILGGYNPGILAQSVLIFA